MTDEIERIENVGCETYKTKCRRCEKEIDLYFNGGELDSTNCCGLRYSLDAPQIDFVVEEERAQK